MTRVRIGPVRIADRTGTHEPGDVVDNPTDDLIALAEAKTKDPETKLPYARLVKPGEVLDAPVPEPEPEPEPAVEPAAEPAPETT